MPPSTQLTSKLLRRLPPRPTVLLHFLSSNHFTPSVFASSTDHNHRHHCRRHDDQWWFSSRHFDSSHYCLSFSRRFSVHADISEPEELFLPVSALISLLDSYHDLTGFPWWIIISSSTVAMRLALFPVIILQIKKLKRIGELLPKIPPPFQLPLSERSFSDQITSFWKEKQAAGCPSFFWFISAFAIQVPCFFLWVMSIRKMSLDHHPGFDCGGILWFQNLTENSHGLFGPIIPLFIGALHFTDIRVSFQQMTVQHSPGLLGLLVKWYSIYLQLLTLPIMLVAFNVPQGSLVYWLTNSSLSLIQQLCLSHPVVIQYLGLPKKNAPAVASNIEKRGYSGAADILILTKQGEIPAQNLSPEELVSFSIKILTDGHKDTAIKLLRLALEKDPGSIRALVIIGQTLLHKKQFAAATECLENAISKLLVAGEPTGIEEVDLLILSSQWAGIALVQQEKMEEGLRHLERIAQLEEPEDSKSKAHYYDGLFLLSSILLNTGQKAEALKYLQKVAAYDPRYNVYLEGLENDDDDFAIHLTSGKRFF
ncbi:ALBINO3-like protein 2, chloroplastic [Henckelia pumila]|uniref:ALBINO3-like protein 2, chloroplastic n=1 Tax=Henckelia pumila TaxID=405737 RepID=UPI003C6E4944